MKVGLLSRRKGERKMVQWAFLFRVGEKRETAGCFGRPFCLDSVREEWKVSVGFL